MAGTWDLVIRNTTIYDGTGAKPTLGDVAINGDRIGAVGDVSGEGVQEIDARNRALAPGFIDVHSHDDFAVFLTPAMDFKVMQGVTTDVVGNCGMGAAPFPIAVAMFSGLHGRSNVPEWDGYAGYLAAIDRNPPSLNVAALVGHGTVRYSAMGNASREPSAKELDHMRAVVREGLEGGALGMSTGLIYEPGRYARTAELIELAREAKRTGGLYASHMRDEAAHLLDAVRETIHIGEEAGVPVQISHHKASGRENWGLVNKSLKLFEQARERGIDVTADQYPYTSGSTILQAVIQNGGLDERADAGAVGTIAPEKLLFASTPKHPEWEGRTLKDLCDQWKLAPQAAGERIAAEEGPGAVVVMETMNEDDVRTVMRHPTTMIGSDGLAMGSRPHPRLYGTFPRVLARYARDAGLMTLEEGVHRMTGMPAAKFGLKERGQVRPGFFADLVIFDPTGLLDTATYDQPRRYPEGLHYVFVNGTAVVRDSLHTGARPGRALRRNS
jgi:N-acyl-D-amino-acid deacylase